MRKVDEVRVSSPHNGRRTASDGHSSLAVRRSSLAVRRSSIKMMSDERRAMKFAMTTHRLPFCRRGYGDSGTSLFSEGKCRCCSHANGDGNTGASFCREGKCRCCHSMACDGVASAAATAAADGDSGSGAMVVPSFLYFKF